MLTASIVAVLLGAPLGRWMHALAMPLLLALAGGKAAMILGGSGQGQLTDVSWATAYLGPGPWGSLAPQLPANPSQAYEALATIVVLLVVVWFLAMGAFRGRNGGALLLGLGLWAVARALVASDLARPPGRRAAAHGPGHLDRHRLRVVRSDGASSAAVSTARGRRARRDPGAGTAGATAGADGEPAWPDPEPRPRI